MIASYLALSLSAQALVLHAPTPGHPTTAPTKVRLLGSRMMADPPEEAPFTYDEYTRDGSKSVPGVTRTSDKPAGADEMLAASIGVVTSIGDAVFLNERSEESMRSLKEGIGQIGGNFSSVLGGSGLPADPQQEQQLPGAVNPFAVSRAEGREVEAAGGEKEPNLMQKVKDAGVAGLVSYMFWELAFWGVSVPVCILGTLTQHALETRALPFCLIRCTRPIYRINPF